MYTDLNLFPFLKSKIYAFFKNTHLHMIHSLFMSPQTGMASLCIPEAQVKPKPRVWALLRIGHFQVGVLENMLHNVHKPLGRPKRTFLGLKNPHEVYRNDFMHAFSAASSHLPWENRTRSKGNV